MGFLHADLMREWLDGARLQYQPAGTVATEALHRRAARSREEPPLQDPWVCSEEDVGVPRLDAG